LNKSVSQAPGCADQATSGSWNKLIASWFSGGFNLSFESCCSENTIEVFMQSVDIVPQNFIMVHTEGSKIVLSMSLVA
jgi:hypothetical protein